MNVWVIEQMTLWFYVSIQYGNYESLPFIALRINCIWEVNPLPNRFLAGLKYVVSHQETSLGWRQEGFAGWGFHDNSKRVTRRVCVCVSRQVQKNVTLHSSHEKKRLKQAREIWIRKWALKMYLVVPIYAMWNQNQKGEQHLRLEDH